MIDLLFDRILPAALLGLVLTCVAGLCYALYAEVTADTFSLRKDQWRCDKSAVVQTYTPVLIGKVTTLVPSHGKRCVVYVAIEAEAAQ